MYAYSKGQVIKDKIKLIDIISKRGGIKIKILKLKTTMDDVKPEINREVLIDKEATYHDLHVMIQKVFGWDDCHLYEFNVKGEKIGLEEISQFGELNYNSKDTVVFRDEKIFSYEYDLADTTRLTLTLM